MADVRKWHLYLGLFTAPSVLFFALTGALQLFSLHEAHGQYRPPVIIEKMSAVHKDQRFATGDHHPPGDPDEVPRSSPDAGAPAHHDGDAHDAPGPGSLALKVYFLIVALCLVVTSSLGLWMGLKQAPRRGVLVWLVVAGTLLPIGLLLS